MTQANMEHGNMETENCQQPEMQGNPQNGQAQGYAGQAPMSQQPAYQAPEQQQVANTSNIVEYVGYIIRPTNSFWTGVGSSQSVLQYTWGPGVRDES